MKKSMFMVALAAMSLASCSNDNVIETAKPGEIKFNATTANASRAAAVYSATELMPKFTVNAAYLADGETTYRNYIQNDVIEKDGSSWKNTSGTRYWADAGTLDFYAVAGAASPEFATWTPGQAPTVAWTVEDEKHLQEDLLYAVNTGEKKEDGAVNLNFRHALAQVVFKAANRASNLYVKVKQIELIYTGKFAKQSTYTLPTADTDGTTVGSWGTATAYLDQFTPLATEVVVPYDATAMTNLTDDNANNGALLVIPQTVTGWNTASGSYDGAIVKLDCEIWNIAGTTFNADTDVPLHIGKAVIPLNATWEQGKKYTYVFTFGETGGTGGDGGYEDDPSDPTPIMETISFTVTVDNFVDVDNQPEAVNVTND